LLYVLTPILPEYFLKRSGLAQGIMGTGETAFPSVLRSMLTLAATAVGGTSFTFAITVLLERFGIRKTLGIVASVSAVLLSIASLLALPPRKFEKRSTKMVGWKTFGDPLFSCLFLVNFIHPLTLAVPMVFGPQFAESLGIKITKASYLLAINSGVGIFSRIPTGLLADRIGHQNTLILATIVYVLATWVLWLPSALYGSVGLYIGMSVCHGLINGVFNISMNSAQKQLFGDEMYYPKNGATTTVRGIGYVIGVPIAGALVRKVADEELSGVDFVTLIVYVGTLLTLSLLSLLNVRRLDARRSGWKWVR
jgi:hypothetical protein